MKFLKKLVLQLCLLFICSNVLAAGLEFTLLPPKTIKPGQLAVQVLPLKSTIGGLYHINFESNLNWSVDGPSEVELKANTVEFITFSTQVPQDVGPGTLHDLKIEFTGPDGGTQTTELSFTISESRDLDFFLPDENATAYSPIHRIPLKITNTGNIAEVYEISINNLIDRIPVKAEQSSVTIEAGTSKIVNIVINFATRNGNHSAFEVTARSNSGAEFSKKFQVKLLRKHPEQDVPRGFEVHSELVVSDDFLYVNDEQTHNGSILYRMHGDLSDYVSMSSYIQANALGSNTDDPNFRFDFTGDNWRASFGEFVGSDIHSGYTRSVDGASFSYDFLSGLQTGIVVGEDRSTGDTHIIGSTGYRFNSRHRTFLVLDKNTSKDEKLDIRAGYQGNMNITDKLTFAPALTFLDNPTQGRSINYTQSIKYMVKNNLPIIINSGYLTNDNQDSLYNELSLYYQSGKAFWELSARSQIDDYSNSSSEEDSKHNTVRAQVSFPIKDTLTGQVIYTFTDENHYTESRPELVLNYKRKSLTIGARFGMFTRDYIDELTNPRQSGDNYFFNGVIGYTGNGYTLNGRFKVEEGNSERRQTLRLSSTWLTPHLFVDSVYAAIGGEWSEIESRDYSSTYVETGVKLSRFKGMHMDFYVRADQNHETDELEYSANLRFYFNDTHKVPRRVTNAFGGKSTGNITGRVCVDSNQNNQCDQGEEGVQGIRVSMGLKSALTDGNGWYDLYDIPQGSKELWVDQAQLAQSGLDIKAPRKEVLVTKNSSATLNFTSKRVSNLKAFVFFDDNADGQFQTEGENVLLGSKVILKQGNVVIAERILTQDAPMVFNKLRDGAYTIEVLSPEGKYEATTQRETSFNLPQDSGKLALVGFKYLPPPEDETQETDILITLIDAFIFPPEYLVKFEIDASVSEFNKLNYASLKVGDHNLVGEITYIEGIFMVSFSLKNLELDYSTGQLSADYKFILHDENGNPKEVNGLELLFLE